MEKCEICGKENVSLLYARHKDYDAIIKICQDCWRKAWDENKLVSGLGSSGGGCCG